MTGRGRRLLRGGGFLRRRRVGAGLRRHGLGRRLLLRRARVRLRPAAFASGPARPSPSPWSDSRTSSRPWCRTLCGWGALRTGRGRGPPVIRLGNISEYSKRFDTSNVSRSHKNRESSWIFAENFDRPPIRARTPAITPQLGPRRSPGTRPRATRPRQPTALDPLCQRPAGSGIVEGPTSDRSRLVCPAPDPDPTDDA